MVWCIVSGSAIGAPPGRHTCSNSPEVQQLLARAYIPLFGTLLHVMARRQSGAEINKITRDTGKALAGQLVQSERLQTHSLPNRAQFASELLDAELGAVSEVVRLNGQLVIQGAGCPLSALTGKHRVVCLAIESVVKEIVGAPVRECCDRIDRRLAPRA